MYVCMYVCVYIYIYTHACDILCPDGRLRATRSTISRRTCRGPQPPLTTEANVSNADSFVFYGVTCLIRLISLLQYSSLLKKTCFRQAVLDKWLQKHSPNCTQMH